MKNGEEIFMFFFVLSKLNNQERWCGFCVQEKKALNDCINS